MSTSTEAAVTPGVLGTIAEYAHALDSGRTDDIVALFLSDGSAEILGIAAVEGHEAIRQLYANMAPTQPQRHLVANTVITSATADEASAVSDFVFVQRGESGWAVGVVGQYEDILHRTEDGWRFKSRKTSFVM
ncbi:nuclear transport factor 2 family protein [Nocardia pseudovaccinii]|uniref:nuclear transport factor 2 family protein n=1 Tax=Nocardia pseudovaccinii TaxID=189540 RepID=UPI003D912773